MQNLVKWKSIIAFSAYGKQIRMQFPGISQKSPGFAVVTNKLQSSVACYANIYFLLLLNAHLGINRHMIGEGGFLIVTALGTQADESSTSEKSSE